VTAPALVYRESDVMARIIRDTLTDTIDMLWVDEPDTCRRVQEWVRVLRPGWPGRVLLYEGESPLFSKYGIQDEGMRDHKPQPRGGSNTIEQTE